MHDPLLSDQPATHPDREAIIFRAELLGHRRLPLEDRVAALHMQGTLSQLLDGLLEEVPGALVIHREGSSAVAAYLKPVPEGLLDGLLHGFERRLQYLRSANSCPCAGCARLEQIRLKVVVHLGRIRPSANPHEWEWTGLEAIRLHRMAQVAVQDAMALLVSQEASTLLGLDDHEDYEPVTVELEGFGTQVLRVHFLDRPDAPPPAPLWERMALHGRKLLWGVNFTR